MVENHDVMTAISRTNRSVILDRERRITRAFDASAKHKHIPAQYQNYDAFDVCIICLYDETFQLFLIYFSQGYLSKNIHAAHAERMERAALNH